MNGEIAKLDTVPKTPEQVTIEAVMAAVNVAFGWKNKAPTLHQTVNVSCAIAAFLKAAENGPQRSLQEWRMAVENLTFHAGR